MRVVDLWVLEACARCWRRVEASVSEGLFLVRSVCQCLTACVEMERARVGLGMWRGTHVWEVDACVGGGCVCGKLTCVWEVDACERWISYTFGLQYAWPTVRRAYSTSGLQYPIQDLYLAIKIRL